MPGANVVKVLEQIAALSAEEQSELFTLILQTPVRNGTSEQNVNNGIVIETASSYDHTPRLRWLERHASKYAGQYIALDGDHLIAHGDNPKEVFAALQASRPPIPYFGYIPAADATLSLGGNLTL